MKKQTKAGIKKQTEKRKAYLVTEAGLKKKITGRDRLRWYAKTLPEKETWEAAELLRVHFDIKMGLTPAAEKGRTQALSAKNKILDILNTLDGPELEAIAGAIPHLLKFLHEAPPANAEQTHGAGA